MKKKSVLKCLLSMTALVSIISLGACATDPNKIRLSDTGLRFWKNSYYLSVAGKPTSIKCSLSPDYNSPHDVPVTYQGKDAEPLFDLEEDLEKIADLKQHCYDRSFVN